MILSQGGGDKTFYSIADHIFFILYKYERIIIRSKKNTKYFKINSVELIIKSQQQETHTQE